VRERVRCDDVRWSGCRLGATLAALAGEAADLPRSSLGPGRGRRDVPPRAAGRALEGDPFAPAPPERFDAPRPRRRASRSATLREELGASTCAAAPLIGDVRSCGRRSVPRRPRRREPLPLEGARPRRAAPASAVWKEEEQRVLVPHLALQERRWMSGMAERETAVTFGRQHRLFGLLTEPSSATALAT